MNSGVDGELLRDEVSDVEKAVKTSRDVIAFYKGAVDTIKKAGDPVAAILAKVKADGSVDAGDKNAVTAADTVLDELIVALRKQKPEASQFALD